MEIILTILGWVTAGVGIWGFFNCLEDWATLFFTEELDNVPEDERTELDTYSMLPLAAYMLFIGGGLSIVAWSDFIGYSTVINLDVLLKCLAQGLALGLFVLFSWLVQRYYDRLPIGKLEFEYRNHSGARQLIFVGTVLVIHGASCVLGAILAAIWVVISNAGV